MDSYIKNVFADQEVASDYDSYYAGEFGKRVDQIERATLREFLPEQKGRLLELGCGTGHWTRYFLEMGFMVTAIDSSEAMLNEARGKSLMADIIQGDAMALTFPDSTFDCVASITMLEFVTDRKQAIKEAVRVLKPGGNLLLGCLNAESVLVKSSQNDPIFKQGNFLTTNLLQSLLDGLDDIRFRYGVHLDKSFNIVDGLPDSDRFEPAFIGVSGQKGRK